VAVRTARTEVVEAGSPAARASGRRNGSPGGVAAHAVAAGHAGARSAPRWLAWATLALLWTWVALPSAAAEIGPRRVVTLAPHLTELVYAAGGGERLVGTVDTSDYPDAARRITRIGDVTRLDAERLLALRPDLVIAWSDGTPSEQLALLRRLGLRTLPMQQNALADVPATLEQLGRLFGTEGVARAAAARFRDELARLRARYAGAQRLAVFYQVWDAPLYTLGGTQVVTEMLAVCGATNVFAEQRQSALPIDVEAVYGRRPDVIVLAGTARETADWRAKWAERPPLRAQFVALDPDLVNRMGPRVVEGTATLCGRLDAVRQRGAAREANR
jgi:iron complex transport system substrate-binding protein